MILLPQQAKRFNRLFDALIIYANSHLAVSSHLITPYGDIDDQEVHEVAQALWGNPDNRELIDQFARENPARLSKTDLREVLRWNDALCGLFVVQRRNRDVLFMYADHLIAVRGLTREIDTILRMTPASVETVLLPFENAVIYAYSIVEYQVGMGSGMQEVVTRETDEALAAGRVIRNAQAFAKAVPQLRATALAREAEHFAEQVELDMNADNQVEGQHPSPLAGLDKDERERLIREHLASIDSPEHDRLIRSMAGQCFKGVPARSLDEAFLRLSKTELQDMARAQRVRGSISAMNKRQLLEALQDNIPRDKDELLAFATLAGPSAIRDLHELVSLGGTKIVPDTQVHGYADVMPSLFPLSLTYHRAGTFVTVMPDDVLAQLRDIDWDTELSAAQETQRAQDFYSLLCDLRGVVPVEEALEDYTAYSGLDFDNDDDYQTAFTILMGIAIGSDAGFELMYLGDSPVLVNVWLAEGLSSLAPREREGILRSILADQDGKPPRPVTDELLAAGSVTNWVLNSPEARALMAYLDEHVPDGQNDYLFSEDVAGDVIDTSRDIDNPAELMHIPEQHGFEATMAQFKRLTDLIMTLYNVVPLWANNGWSPNELHAQTGY